MKHRRNKKYESDDELSEANSSDSMDSASNNEVVLRDPSDFSNDKSFKNLIRVLKNNQLITKVTIENKFLDSFPFKKQNKIFSAISSLENCEEVEIDKSKQIDFDQLQEMVKNSKSMKRLRLVHVKFDCENTSDDANEFIECLYDNFIEFYFWGCHFVDENGVKQPLLPPKAAEQDATTKENDTKDATSTSTTLNALEDNKKENTPSTTTVTVSESDNTNVTVVDTGDVQIITISNKEGKIEGDRDNVTPDSTESECTNPELKEEEKIKQEQPAARSSKTNDEEIWKKESQKTKDIFARQRAKRQAEMDLIQQKMNKIKEGEEVVTGFGVKDPEKPSYHGEHAEKDGAQSYNENKDSKKKEKEIEEKKGVDEDDQEEDDNSNSFAAEKYDSDDSKETRHRCQKHEMKKEKKGDENDNEVEDDCDDSYASEKYELEDSREKRSRRHRKNKKKKEKKKKRAGNDDDKEDDCDESYASDKYDSEHSGERRSRRKDKKKKEKRRSRQDKNLSSSQDRELKSQSSERVATSITEPSLDQAEYEDENREVLQNAEKKKKSKKIIVSEEDSRDGSNSAEDYDSQSSEDRRGRRRKSKKKKSKRQQPSKDGDEKDLSLKSTEESSEMESSELSETFSTLSSEKSEVLSGDDKKKKNKTPTEKSDETNANEKVETEKKPLRKGFFRKLFGPRKKKQSNSGPTTDSSLDDESEPGRTRNVKQKEKSKRKPIDDESSSNHSEDDEEESETSHEKKSIKARQENPLSSQNKNKKESKKGTRFHHSKAKKLGLPASVYEDGECTGVSTQYSKRMKHELKHEEQDTSSEEIKCSVLPASA